MKFAWSYSALTRFENCPKQYYHMNVVKDVKDLGNDTTREGQRVHRALYDRVIRSAPLPVDLRRLEPVAARFDDVTGAKYGEMKLALTAQFQQTEWFADNVWLRVILDLMVVNGAQATIVDWKTGKPRRDDTQLGLMAAACAAIMPEVKTFRTAFLWVGDRSGPPTVKPYEQADMAHVWNGLLPRVDKIQAAIRTTSFPAKPSGLCRYCPVTKCPHHEEQGG